MMIIDTDVCIELLSGNGAVIERRRRYGGAVAVSFMTAAELFFGAANSSDPAANESIVDQFLLSVLVVQPDLAILRLFGTIKAELQRDGTPVADADIFIAATVLSRGARLVTGNTRHFERISGVVMENWT